MNLKPFTVKLLRKFNVIVESVKKKLGIFLVLQLRLNKSFNGKFKEKNLLKNKTILHG